MNNRICNALRLLCLCLLLLPLTGCGGDPAPAATAPPSSTATAATSSDSATAQGGYTAPPMQTAEFHPEQAVEGGGVKIDLSAVSQGYVAVQAQNDQRMKFIIRKGEVEYKYDLPGNGETTIYPLQSGDGSYTFHAYQNTSGSSYIEVFTQSAEVTLESETAPFVRPSQQVNYTAQSQCVTLAAQLAGSAADQPALVSAVYKYVQDNIKYDYDFAANAPKGYVAAPDATLSSKKGICVDYAALVAAMLRSQGVPTKMITGYVSPGDLYHAWNMIYLEGTGWITVEIKASANQWQRVDLTFAANGADGNFIGDGTSYVDRYVY